MGLTDEFQKFVGLILKDPNRMTTDIDENAEKICGLAAQKGLHVDFTKLGEPEEPFMLDVEGISVQLTKEGVPDDKKAWGWRVESIRPL